MQVHFCRTELRWHRCPLQGCDGAAHGDRGSHPRVGHRFLCRCVRDAVQRLPDCADPRLRGGSGAGIRRASRGSGSCLTEGVDLIRFIKEHAAFISNAAVVLLVLAAIYVKITDEGADVMFKAGDAYIIVGAFLALLVLRMVAKRQKK